MKTVSKPAVISLIAAICMAAQVFAKPCGGERTPFDAVFVEEGSNPLLGARIARLRAFSFDGKRFREVPVQADEKNVRGDYVLDGGLPYTKASDDGYFDDNDEWVVDGDFFGADFGAEQALAAPEAASSTSLWKVRYCTGEVFHGSLLVAAGGDERSDFSPAIRFDPAARSVVGGDYRYSFHPTNAALLGKVEIASGDEYVDVIEDSTFVMPLAMPWWLPDLIFRQKDFEGAIESWQVGPLRTIVAVGVKYQAFLSLFKLHLFSELVFYRNRFQVPTVIEFVFDPSQFLRPGSGVAYAIRFPEGREWQLETNLASLPPLAPEKLAERQVTAEAYETFYAQGSRPEASFRVEVKVDKRARQMVPPPYLVEGSQFADAGLLRAWPWLEELTGDLGLFLDFSNVDAGIYEFGLDLFLSPGANLKLTDQGSTNANWQRLR